jgi:hypothetical protein
MPVGFDVPLVGDQPEVGPDQVVSGIAGDVGEGCINPEEAT